MQHRIFLPIAGIDLPRQQALPYFPGGGAGGARAREAERGQAEGRQRKDKDEGK